VRLDIYLVAEGIVRSRGRARDMISAGKISVNGRPAAKGSLALKEDDVVTVLEADHPYVSRSALKLKGLLDAVPLRLEGKTVVDIGSSTGGFTQVSLEYGAGHVYAVDVGTAQLDEALREDARVTVCENLDAREITVDRFDRFPTALVADVSFISLQKVLPPVLAALNTVDTLCLLVKPQFELDKSAIGKGGLVKNEEDRLRALRDVGDCIETLGFQVLYDMPSALAGADGNEEFMLYAKKTAP